MQNFSICKFEKSLNEHPKLLILTNRFGSGPTICLWIFFNQILKFFLLFSLLRNFIYIGAFMQNMLFREECDYRFKI